MAELRRLLHHEWAPLADADADALDACAFRVASLLGSRAPATALAEELGRIRLDDLHAAADPAADTRAARQIASWFASAPT